VSPSDKPIVWLGEAVRTPPLSASARTEIGFLLRRLQRGDALSLPISRPMPTIGTRVAELRITDEGRVEWRLIYRPDEDAVVVVALFKKKTQATPKQWIENSRERLRRYDRAAGGE
jgi:phage-related protein